MKEEFIEQSIDMTIENGILLSYSGASRVVVVPENVKRIGIDAFANKNIESVLLPEGLESIERGAFRNCRELTFVKIPEGVVQIADSAFSGCTALRYVIIPDSVLIIGQRAFASHSDGLIIVAKKDSFAYNYAKEKKLLISGSEEELAEIIKKARSATGGALSYRELEIFGEKIRVSSSLPLCDEIYEHYNEASRLLANRILSRQHIANAEFITDVITDFILAAATRVNAKGALTNGTEMLKRVGAAATTLREGFFAYQKILLDLSKYEIDKKHARDKFEALVADFANELANAEIECLGRHGIVHTDATKGLDKKKAEQIAAIVMSRDECAEVSLALSLKLYPYNPALIKHAVRCGSLCDGLVELVGLFRINLVGEYIFSLVDRQDLFGVADVSEFVRGEFDKIISEQDWGRFTARGISPAPFAQMDLTSCISRESAVEKVAGVLRARKEKLDRLYENAASLYAKARSKKELRAAVSAFRATGGYGDSQEKIKEIEGRLKRKRNFGIFIGIACVASAIAVALGIIFSYLYKEVKPILEDYGSYYAVVDYRGLGEKCVVPKEYRGKPVRVIASGAFEDCKTLEKIVIPEGIVSVGASAFRGCRELEEIILPSTVESVGERAFFGCINLDKAYIPGGVKRIESGTFVRCRELEELTICKGVEYIGDNAFDGCEELELISIPETVISIGNYAFSNCTSLREIIYASGASEWERVSITEDSSSWIDKVRFTEN